MRLEAVRNNKLLNTINESLSKTHWSVSDELTFLRKDETDISKIVKQYEKEQMLKIQKRLDSI